MIITSKEDFESLSDTARQDLETRWLYPEDFDMHEQVDYYRDIDIPEVEIKDLLEWEVDYCRCNVEARVWVDMPMVFDRYYHEHLASPDLHTPVLSRHYWMFMGLFQNRKMCYDSKQEEIDGYEDAGVIEDLSESLKRFFEGFHTFAEGVAKKWLEQFEKSAQEDYEHVTSEEYLIETLIANEVEVDNED